MSTDPSLPGQAIAAWNRRFGKRHCELGSNEPEPFKLGQRLGGGGNGIVYATELDGIPLALKRIHTRKVEVQHLNEIAILRQLSGVQHEHVVTLIGSCFRRRKRDHEIDILMYPVAQWDLASFLDDLDVLIRWNERPGTTKEEKDNAQWAIETFSTLSNDPQQTFNLESQSDIKLLIFYGQRRLAEIFGCIAQAVAYMHRQKIRHKDLKPSQILLSPEGLWLTDFGWSLNTAELSQTATSNGYPMTVKYQAPERANGKACGRAEDIFALGCTFVEMGLRMTESGAQIRDGWVSRDDVRWSFQANLGQLEEWLAPLSDSYSFLREALAPLLRKMMAYDPDKRPMIENVVEALAGSVCPCPSRKRDGPPETVLSPRHGASEPAEIPSETANVRISPSVWCFSRSYTSRKTCE